MVESQIANLILGLSFDHNLCCICPNGSCEAIFDVRMAHVMPFSTSTHWNLFNGIENTSRRGVLTPAIELWIFGSPRGFPSPHFGSVIVILTLLQSGVATFTHGCHFLLCSYSCWSSSLPYFMLLIMVVAFYVVIKIIVFFVLLIVVIAFFCAINHGCHLFILFIVIILSYVPNYSHRVLLCSFKYY
jgi:hypothetical protein